MTTHARFEKLRRRDKLKLQIENRKTIEKIAQNPFLPGVAVISICDSNCEFAKLIYKPDSLLCVRFDDIGEDIYEDILGRNPTPQERRMIEKKYHMITDCKASEIAEFYFHVKEKAKTLICQCEHGESRSAAVAAAIAEFEKHNGLQYFIDEKYCPNKLVFRKVFAALQTVKKNCVVGSEYD